MKIGTKITLTYTVIIASVIALVAILFYFITTGYIDHLADSYNAEKAVLSELRQYLGWMLLGLVVVCSCLVYLVGMRYTNRMIRRIDDAYQGEKAFVRSASHELNNPLTAIQGECEIILLKERSPAEYQVSIQKILSETRRIIQLMKHLLFLSRGDRDILRNATEPIFLAEFMMQFVEGRIDFSPDNFSFVVNANPHLLKIAIENILNNACKYSHNKPVEVILRVNVLEIKDHGIGIPPDELQHIFQPFFRASNTREYAGHGIGLALSLRILQIYNAKITVFSELEKGTTVTINFP